jgi:hypothetical protein
MDAVRKIKTRALPEGEGVEGEGRGGREGTRTTQAPPPVDSEKETMTQKVNS